jgi:L-fucose isomerase-like protein
MKATSAVKRIVGELKRDADTSAVDDEILTKMAKFELALKRFIDDRKLDALAIQCWTSIQENLGISPCTTMSRFDDRGIPCACEADITGALSMHALQLASDCPSCLADWNNLHNDDPELVNCWHCGVFPMSWAKTRPRIGCQEIISATTGRDRAMGVVEFVMRDGSVTLCRVTQDSAGAGKAMIAQGQVEPNPAKTFGSYGWVRLPGIDKLYKDVLLRHFPHHVAMNRSQVGNILWEALGNYMGLEVYTAERTSGRWTPELPFAVEDRQRPGRSAKRKARR